MHQLELFYFDSCPYCQMVISVVEQLKIKVTYKNILDDKSALDKLVSDTGRRTVPCLYIDGNPMHESKDIIEWLQSNKEKLEKK